MSHLQDPAIKEEYLKDLLGIVRQSSFPRGECLLWLGGYDISGRPRVRAPVPQRLRRPGCRTQLEYMGVRELIHGLARHDRCLPGRPLQLVRPVITACGDPMCVAPEHIMEAGHFERLEWLSATKDLRLRLGDRDERALLLRALVPEDVLKRAPGVSARQTSEEEEAERARLREAACRARAAGQGPREFARLYNVSYSSAYRIMKECRDEGR